MGGRKLQTSILLPTKINHQEKKVNHSHKIRWQKIRVQCSTLTTLENRRTGYRIQIQIYLTRCTSSSELDEIWLFKCYVVPETKAMNRDSKDILCNAMKDHNADVLVLGSHGKRRIKSLFFRSVNEHCVRHVHCPVIVIKNQKSKTQ
ncbi:universal stress protein A-like protein isoform X1 [Cryptomeria japonica]|uniref:universal stress protein A-like protein isoform X1 n=1 Tax=Cryptomeria japonica TaxID=3369 RepID=UPI0027D9FAF3|nr:universal stress protein A-like protein isoform X1 [Cryptomeria japonica]